MNGLGGYKFDPWLQVIRGAALLFILPIFFYRKHFLDMECCQTEKMQQRVMLTSEEVPEFPIASPKP